MPTYEGEMPKLTVGDLMSAIRFAMESPDAYLLLEIGGIEMRIFPALDADDLWGVGLREQQRQRRFTDFMLALECQSREVEFSFSFRVRHDQYRPLAVGIRPFRGSYDLIWLPCEIVRVGAPGPLAITIPFLDEPERPTRIGSDPAADSRRIARRIIL